MHIHLQTNCLISSKAVNGRCPLESELLLNLKILEEMILFSDVVGLLPVTLLKK